MRTLQHYQQPNFASILHREYSLNKLFRLPHFAESPQVDQVRPPPQTSVKSTDEARATNKNITLLIDIAERGKNSTLFSYAFICLSHAAKY